MSLLLKPYSVFETTLESSFELPGDLSRLVLNLRFVLQISHRRIDARPSTMFLECLMAHAPLSAEQWELQAEC